MSWLRGLLTFVALVLGSLIALILLPFTRDR